MSRSLRIAYIAHSVRSDWNNGNAHFLRGLLRSLAAMGHAVTVFEPLTEWSIENLRTETLGSRSLADFSQTYSELMIETYDARTRRPRLARAPPANGHRHPPRVEPACAGISPRRHSRADRIPTALPRHTSPRLLHARADPSLRARPLRRNPRLREGARNHLPRTLRYPRRLDPPRSRRHNPLQAPE